MKVLVTGGAGFIGSHIVDALVERGVEVVIVDNMSAGFERNINARARLYRLSICESELTRVFEQERPRLVIHQAAQTVVARSIANPAFDAQENILGSLNVISNCCHFGVEKIVYASSSAVYGEPQYLPLDEEHPINPISQYGVSKHTVEHYLYLYNVLYGLDYVALRYANVYGPRQNPAAEAGVVAIFTGKLLAGEQPTIFGSGHNSRDYVYVGDVARANILAMEPTKSGVYNIGTGKETSVQRIFNIISRESGYEGVPHYAAERRGELKRMCIDYSKAMKKLEWIPLVSFEEDIARTVEYYRSQLVNR